MPHRVFAARTLSGKHSYFEILSQFMVVRISSTVFYRCIVFVAMVVASVAGQQSASAQDLQSLGSAIETVARVYRQIATEYVDTVNPNALAKASINGLLTELDPYSVYLQGSESEPYDRLSSGTYVGFGYTVGQYNKKLIITEVRPGYPAAEAGLRRGDRLCSVDGIRVDTLAVDSLLSVTRGELGSTSVYRITRSEKDTLTFSMQRSKIRVQNVGTCMRMSNDVAYVELLRFARNAPLELMDSLLALTQQGPLKGIILDLRDNPGGLLESAVGIANLFLPQGTLVSYTMDRTGRRNEYLATNRPMDVNVPVVVLVNEHSASASEVLAGALQDLDRAVVVGRQSFGKGLVQNILAVNDSASIKLTTARYYTPSGRCVQRRFRMDPTQDSTSRFLSRRGRHIHAASGIMPDSVVPDLSVSPLLSTVNRSGLFLAFASQFMATRTLHEAQQTSVSRIVEAFTGFISTQPEQLISSTLYSLRLALDSAKAQGEPTSTIVSLEQARKAVLKDVMVAIRTNSAYFGPVLRANLQACSDVNFDIKADLIPFDTSIRTAQNIIRNGEYVGLLSGDSLGDQ